LSVPKQHKTYSSIDAVKENQMKLIYALVTVRYDYKKKEDSIYRLTSIPKEDRDTDASSQRHNEEEERAFVNLRINSFNEFSKKICEK